MAAVTSYKTTKGVKKWKASIYLGLDPKTGKKRYKVLGGKKTKREAVEAAKNLELELQKGDITVEQPSKRKKRFRDVYAEWLKYYKNTVRESTWSKTRDCFNLHILPTIGDMYVDMITVQDMQEAVEKWYDASPVAFKRYLVHASRILDYAVNNDLIDTNPAKRIISPRKPEKVGQLAEFWDKDQLNYFFSCLNPEKEPYKFVLFRVLAYTGVRIGECLALEWEDIDFHRKTLSVNKTLAYGVHGKTIVNPPKTRASRREVPMDDTTLSYLRKWKIAQHVYLTGPYRVKSKHQLVFCTSHNRHYRIDKPGMWLATVERKNDITPRISLHKLRKSYVSNLLIAGVPVSTVQKLVGHSDPRITLAIYAFVSKNDEKEAATRLSDYLDDH